MASTFTEAYPGAVKGVVQFLISGGFFMALIFACSLLAAAVTIWKALELRKQRIVPPALSDAIDQTAEEGTLGPVTSLVQGGDTVLGRISGTAAEGAFTSLEEAQERVQASAREEVLKMETGVAILEVVITIAPLLGLLGTVKGLVSVFSTLGAGADIGADPARIALGIAEALNTTIAGLAVAVPTVIAHSFFTKKIENLSVRMEVLTGKLLNVRFRGNPVV